MRRLNLAMKARDKFEQTQLGTWEKHRGKLTENTVRHKILETVILAARNTIKA